MSRTREPALLLLLVASCVAAPRSPAERAQARADHRGLGLEVGVVGAVALCVGAAAGLDALAKTDEARVAGCNQDLSECPSDALPLAQRAYARGNLATGFLIGGAAAVGVGLALWLTAPSAPDDPLAWRIAPAVGPDRAGLVMSHGF